MQTIGINRLRTLGVVFSAVIFGKALVGKLLAGSADAGGGLFVLLLLTIFLISPIAYFVREARRRKPVRHDTRRARERTRISA
jgi:hypothetical protein